MYLTRAIIREKTGYDNSIKSERGDINTSPFHSLSYYLPVEKLSATFELAGETRMYPCISWCSAEQKSVQ